MGWACHTLLVQVQLIRTRGSLESSSGARAAPGLPGRKRARRAAADGRTRSVNQFAADGPALATAQLRRIIDQTLLDCALSNLETIQTLRKQPSAPVNDADMPVRVRPDAERQFLKANPLLGLDG